MQVNQFPETPAPETPAGGNNIDPNGLIKLPPYGELIAVISFPKDIVLEIFKHLGTLDFFSLSGVCNSWNANFAEYAKQRFVEEHAIGRSSWAAKFGEETLKRLGVDLETFAPLPNDIYETLTAVSPHNEGKKVFEDHMLFYIPPGMTINKMLSLFPENDGYVWPEITNQIGSNEHPGGWCLMTKEGLKGSFGKTRDEQLAMASEKKGYQAPFILEAIVGIVMSDEHGFGRDPYRRFTCCQEKINGLKTVVGGFAASGLSVNRYFDSDYVGVASSRKP